MRPSIVLGVLVFTSVVCAYRMPSLNDFNAPASSQHNTRSVEGSCDVYTYKCVNQGGNCTSALPEIALCYDGYCPYPSYICPTYAGLGASCVTQGCTPVNLVCHPNTQVCVYSYTLRDPGADCSSDNDCEYTNSTGTYSFCQSGKCYGQATGGSCTSNTQCVGDNYCNSGVCAATVSDGSSCTGSSSDGCGPSSTCNLGTCIRIGTLSAGASCSDSTGCNDGLYCNTASGTCKSPIASGIACSTASDCPDSAACGCAASQTNTTCIVEPGNPSGFAGLQTSIGDCLSKYNCRDIQCLQNNCASSYCSYRTFLLNTLADLPDCYLTYYKNAFVEGVIPNIAACSSSSTNAAAHQAASVVLVLLAVVSVVLSL